jgi:hypothetical protein
MLLDTFNPWKTDGKLLFRSLGEMEGVGVAGADWKAQELVRGRANLRAHAALHFPRWWHEMKESWSEGVRKLADEATETDLQEMCRQFSDAFITGYLKETEHFDKYYRAEVTICIVRTEHTEYSHVYEIELTDPKHLNDPVHAEIEVNSDGEAELREVAQAAAEE